MTYINAGNVFVMKHLILTFALILSLSACGETFSNPFEALKKKPPAEEPASEEPLSAIDPPAEPDVSAPSEPSVVEVGAVGQNAASLDKSTTAEKQAASTAPAGATFLGTTIASLGDPTEQGFWLRTPLVETETQGSVETESGAVVQLKLIPIDGPSSAGSRISLAAMRGLNLGLTDLASLKVSKS